MLEVSHTDDLHILPTVLMTLWQARHIIVSCVSLCRVLSTRARMICIGFQSVEDFVAAWTCNDVFCLLCTRFIIKLRTSFIRTRMICIVFRSVKDDVAAWTYNPVILLSLVTLNKILFFTEIQDLISFHML